MIQNINITTIILGAKKCRSFLLFVLLLNSAHLYAQTAPANLSLNLQKARQIAVGEHADVLTKNVEVLIAKETVKRVKRDAFPEVFTDLNLQRNLIIPATPVPAIAFNPNAGVDELLLLKFSAKWTGNAGLNVNYDLFNPENKSNLRQAKIKAALAETDMELSIIEVLQHVSNAYVAALIAQEQLKLNQAEVQSKMVVYKMVSAQFREGRLTLIAYNNEKVSLNNAVSQLNEAENIVTKANAELIYEMGFNPLQPIQLTFEDTIESLFINYNSLAQNNKQALNLQRYEQETKLLEDEKLGAKTKYYPKVSLGAFYGSNYFDNNFDILKQMNWHGNSYVKVGVRIPLTAWMNLENERAVINHQLTNKRLAYKSLENKAALNYFKALKDVQANETKFETAKANFALEQESYQLMQKQFAEGRLLVGDLAKADYRVQAAKNEYLHVANDFLIAKMSMEYEHGN